MSETLEATAATAARSSRQFVTFHIEDDLFGVPLEEVQEIIRMPDVVQVPLCRPTLEGVANLRGAVLPITNLRRLFGAPPGEHDDATRVVVVHHAQSPAGFVVDRMASVITAEAEEIEAADVVEATVQSDMLRGIVKRAGGLIMLLDPARLTAVDQLTTFGTGLGLGAGAVESPATQPEAQTNDEIQVVSFEVASQEYAFPIDDVREIVQVPDKITRVPQAPPHIVGVMTLRDRLLPLVSLRRMFSLPDAELNDQSRIVVVAPDAASAESVGIVMDTVKEVLRINRSLADPVPPMLAARRDGGPSEFEAICRLNGGKRLVTILSAERMFRHAAMREALEAAGAQTGALAAHEETDMDAGAADEEQFVVFRLAGEEYGVPIGTVQEIVRVPDELTKVPKAAIFMEGVINLRGAVLPVVDQRRRFGLDDAARNDRQRIMVLTIGGVRTGFIVDQVSEVIKISRSAIEPAPSLSPEQALLIRRVANLERQKRMILLLDTANLLNAGEIKALEAL